jgi:hypothetical protein
MKTPALQAIALLAAAIVCVQNFPVLTGVSWAVIHGAGVRSALGFVPATIALAVLWAGYRVIQSRVTSHVVATFAAFAVAVIVLNETVLPTTPLKEWRDQGATAGVRILNRRDEPLLSARGNPIGVRISFDAVPSRTGAYMISASTLHSASGETIWPLHFGTALSHQVQPAPAAQSDSPYSVFQKDVIYTVSQDMLPNFVHYDQKTKTPCLTGVGTKYLTEAQFQSALAANRDTSLRVAIQVEGEQRSATVAADGVTSRRYDLRAIYDTIAKEGGGHCAR